MNELAMAVPTEAPPPGPELLARVQRIAPVRTRRPGLTLVTAILLSAVAPAYLLHTYPMRRDLGALPGWWVALAAGAWALAVVVLVARAFLPRRGEVLPNMSEAFRAAVITTIGMVGVGLVFTIDAPCCTIVPAGRWSDFSSAWWHCVSFGLRTSLPTLMVGALLLRGLVWVRGARMGAVLGAAGGALAGLTLHLLCPIGGALHVGLAHGGGVLIGAAIGGVVLGLAFRHPR
jgi:hypothetical protein